MSRDAVGRCVGTSLHLRSVSGVWWAAEWRVVLGRVEGEFTEEFAVLGVDDADVEVGDQGEDSFAAVLAAQAGCGVAGCRVAGDHASGVDLVSADPEVDRDRGLHRTGFQAGVVGLLGSLTVPAQANESGTPVLTAWEPVAVEPTAHIVCTMRDLPRNYATEVQRAFGVWAAWPPEDPLRIGTLGRLENGLFVPESSLDGRGMEIATQTSPGTSQRFYATEGKVSLSMTAGIESKGSGARATIAFASGSAIVVALSDCRTVRPVSPVALLDAMCTQAQTDSFDQDWHVISSLTVASAGLIAMSKSSDATLEVTLGQAAGTLQNALLAGGGLEITRAVSMGFHTTIQGAVTPLFTLQRLSRRRGRVILRGEDAYLTPSREVPFVLTSVDPES